MNNGVNLSFLLHLDVNQKSPFSCHKIYIHTARVYRRRSLLLLLLIQIFKDHIRNLRSVTSFNGKTSAFLNDLLSQLCYLQGTKNFVFILLILSSSSSSSSLATCWCLKLNCVYHNNHHYLGTELARARAHTCVTLSFIFVWSIIVLYCVFV